MSQTCEKWKGAYEGHYPTMASAVFLTPAEFLGHAMDAYNAAKRNLLPDPGSPWLDSCGSWSTAQGFYESLTARLAERLRRRALLTGHLVEVQIEDDASDNKDLGAGRSPADVGHGWPVVALAAGCGATDSSNQVRGREVGT